MANKSTEEVDDEVLENLKEANAAAAHRLKEDMRPREISLKVKDKLFTHLRYPDLQTAKYKDLVKAWRNFREEEVVHFVWIRQTDGLNRCYIIQDDNDLTSALQTETHLILGAQGKPRSAAEYIVIGFLVLFCLFNYDVILALVWEVMTMTMQAVLLPKEIVVYSWGLLKALFTTLWPAELELLHEIYVYYKYFVTGIDVSSEKGN